MGWWDRTRERNQEGRAQIAERPVASWVAHSLIFAAFAMLLQKLRGGPVDPISALLLGSLVAAGLVAGTVYAHRRHGRRSDKP